MCPEQAWSPHRRGNTSCTPPATTSICPSVPPRDGCGLGQTTGGASWTVRGSEGNLPAPRHPRDRGKRKSGVIVPLLRLLQRRVPSLTLEKKCESAVGGRVCVCVFTYLTTRGQQETGWEVTPHFHWTLSLHVDFYWARLHWSKLLFFCS